MKMEFALWNRATVMQLVERECGIKLSVRGVGNYLDRCYQGSGTHQGQVENRCNRAHAGVGEITRGVRKFFQDAHVKYAA
jgi:hypothetical protein